MVSVSVRKCCCCCFVRAFHLKVIRKSLYPLFSLFFQVPKIAVVGSGGGFRAMVSLSGVFCALKDMGLLDCVMYTAGLSGSTW